MKKNIVFLLALVVMLVFLSGCGILESIKDSLGDGEDGTQTIKSDVTGLSLEFPKSWKKEELNDVASIEMARLSKEQYMVVIEEEMADFEDGITVDDYAEIILENMSAAVEGSGNPTIKEVTIADGIVAKQFELAGTISKIKAKYLVTCVENDGVFYQFTAWSLQSKYDAAKPVFDTILDTISFGKASNT